MALTQEQIKDLKPGDKLCCTCSFVATEDYGNRIVVDMCYAGSKERTTSRISYFYEQLSLPPTPPKHDPCRPFKKGDKVKPAERHGRKTPKLNYKAEYTVTSSEDDYGTVGVEYFNGAMTVCVSIPFYWLELVTPVEELEPYHILHNAANGYVVYKNEPKTDNIVVVFNKTHPNAKAAAEAECARLNAEWRKEQNNE